MDKLRAVVAAMAAWTLAVQASAPAEPTLALVGGRIYPSPDAAAIDDGVVIVAGATIAAVGRRRSVKIPAGATTIDCSGAVVTAGFQNSHVHFTEPKWNDADKQPASTLTAQLQAMLTRYGFTAVVDTASLLPNTIALRRRIESHEVAGPRILTAGLALYPPDGIPYYLKEAIPADLLKLLLQPSTPREAADIVRRSIDGGADIIKLFTGSNVSPARVLPMPDDVAVAAVAAAHRRGKLVFAHPSNVAGLEVALRAHIDVLAHAIEDTRGLTSEHLRRMKQQNMALVPTLKLLGDGDDRQQIRDEVQRYANIGGQVLFGTDVGYLTDSDPSREYELMGGAGLTWREILASLTTNPAARFREAARRGRVAKGMAADLVVLRRDPAHDVRAFADVRSTIRAGRVCYESAGSADGHHPARTASHKPTPRSTPIPTSAVTLGVNHG
jgi:imidazolonepropionase-like amidohydrolase